MPFLLSVNDAHRGQAVPHDGYASVYAYSLLQVQVRLKHRGHRASKELCCGHRVPIELSGV